MTEQMDLKSIAKTLYDSVTAFFGGLTEDWTEGRLGDFPSFRAAAEEICGGQAVHGTVLAETISAERHGAAEEVRDEAISFRRSPAVREPTAYETVRTIRKESEAMLRL